MIDTRHGYAVARKINEQYLILTAKRPKSTVILLNANLEPVSRFKQELEAEGAAGLILIRIVDDMILEVADETPGA